MMDHRPLLAALAVLALAPLAACSGEGDDNTAQQGEKSLADAIGAEAGLSEFAAALKKTGLEGVFAGPADYTVLAPKNEAFARLGKDVDAAVQAAILREHILPGAIMPEDIKASLKTAGGKGISMATMGRDAVTFTLENDRIVASGGDGGKAVLSDAPVRARNGVVIPVDALLKDSAAPGS